jgi:hypothetical protein
MDSVVVVMLFAKGPMIIHERGKQGAIVTTRNGTHPAAPLVVLKILLLHYWYLKYCCSTSGT